MNANELIERYVQEVGNYLPRKGREDIQQELKSLLQDTLEERAAGVKPTVQEAADVLLEFGRPQDIAAQYHSHQQLIGGQLYPLYRQVTGIVLVVMTVFYVVLLAIVLWNAENLPQAVWGWLTEYGQSIFVCIGIITLIFVAIERLAGDEIELEQAAFDPLALPPVNDPNRISRFEVIAEIVASVIGLVVFLSFVGREGLFGAFVAEGFRPTIGWLVASMGLDVMVKVLVLWHNRWRLSTRLFDIGAEIFGIYVLYRVISAESILTISALNAPLKLGLSVVLIILVVVTIVKIIQLAWKRDLRTTWQPVVLVRK